MRKSALEQFAEKQRKAKESIQLNSVDDLLKLMLDDRSDPRQRKINPTQRAFILDPATYKAYMGPAGCAKTSTGVAEIFLKALLLPGTKWFIARKNYNDLIDTTLRTAQNILNRLPEGTLIDRSKMPPMKWWIRPMTQAGTSAADNAPSEITFMGLTDDVGSYEFTGGFIDEADEVERKYFEQLKGRLRYKPYPEYPSDNFSISLAFNPPAKSHWLYTVCTGLTAEDEPAEEPASVKLFRPEPRENTRNLPDGYYERMDSMPEELRLRLRDGGWGDIFPGEPVVRQFKKKTHVRECKYVGSQATLFRFEDFGFHHPAVLWTQISKTGILYVLSEYKGLDITAEQFAADIHRLTKERYPTAYKFQDTGDPAVAQKKDTGSTLAILANAGIQVMYRDTPFELSMNLLRQRFNMMIDGEPAIQIDPSCRLLIDGLAGGYHFKDDGVTPHKGLYDHLIDALRYGVYWHWGTSASTNGRVVNDVAYWSKQ